MKISILVLSDYVLAIMLPFRVNPNRLSLGVAICPLVQGSLHSMKYNQEMGLNYVDIICKELRGMLLNMQCFFSFSHIDVA
jgi:hypothetical protein